MRWILVGCLVIVAYDAVFALAARALNIAYWNLGDPWAWLTVLPSSGIYVAAAFLAARETHLAQTGAIVGGAVAFADVTVGWAVLSLIAPRPPGDVTPELVIFTVTSVTLVGGGLGLAAGTVARRIGRKSPARAH